MFKAIHYCWLIYLRTFRPCVIKYMSSTCSFSFSPGLAWHGIIDLLTGIDLILIIEKSTRGGKREAIHQRAKGHNSSMKNYDENKELSHLKHWDVNNLHLWATSQNLP